MKNLKNKTIPTTIALILMLTIPAILVALPNTSAHTPPWTDIPVHMYTDSAPGTVGLGQSVNLLSWTDWLPQTAEGAYGNRWTFYLDIARPDGTNETVGPITSDPVGNSYYTYTPTQLGEYTVVARFIGMKITGLPLYPGRTIDQISGAAYVNDTFAPATSEPNNFTVTNDPSFLYEETPLPTDYWTRPINGLNRFWYSVAANWLGGAAQTNGPTSSFQYGKAPESAHVMWSTPLWEGGVMDARFGATGYYTGLSYESLGDPVAILNGRIYYNVMAPPRYGWWAIDLYTGEKLFFHNTTGPVQSNRGGDGSGYLAEGAISFASILNYDSPNQHGGIPYLWADNVPTALMNPVPRANTWDMFDPFTGNYICSINNTQLATGTAVYGKDGSILRYNLVNIGTTSAPNYRLTVWNTTKAILDSHPEIGNWYWRYRPYLNYTHDGRLGFSLNVSISSILGPRNAVVNQTGTIRTVREGEYVIIGTSGRNDDRGTVTGYLRALSLKPESYGTTLWDITFTPPKATDAFPNSTYLAEGSAPELGTVDPEDGVFVFEERVSRTRWGYSLATGQLLWGPTAEEGQWNYYGMSDSIYEGKLFSYGYSGELIAYNITTGKILWTWTAPSEGLGETFYGYSPLSMSVIADGKLYLYSTEHSPSMPLRRDSHSWALNATTGELIWKITHWGALKLADGFLVGSSLFDNQIYCYGKGPSGTTVSAPQTVPTLGSSMMITGTVTDQSPSGRHDSSGVLSMPLKGTPAIADADQEAWMEYLFMQRPKPTNATGVTVTLDAVDPNGNYINIGTATTDLTGVYGLKWTPEIPGVYQVIAKFAGSASYGSSYAQTYVGVNDEPTTTAAPTETPPSASDMYFVPAVAGIIVAIAIGFAVTILVLRKRP